MRIAVAYDCLFPWSTGGGERQYRVFAEEFAAAGHEVTYLTRNQWDGPPPRVNGLTVRIVSDDRELYDATGTRTAGPRSGSPAGSSCTCFATGTRTTPCW